MDTERTQRSFVFVYGTLMKDQPNNYVIKDMSGTSHSGDVVFVGKATTVNKYPLVISGPFNLPMLLDVKDTGKNVGGEVYDVNDEALKRLDDFEGHPTFYERLEIDIAIKGASGEGTPKTCWTYFIKDYTQCDIDRPHLESYDSNGDHGLLYDTSENNELDAR